MCSLPEELVLMYKKIIACVPVYLVLYCLFMLCVFKNKEKTVCIYNKYLKMLCQVTYLSVMDRDLNL